MLFILIALLSLLLQFFLPWWILALVALGMAAWMGLSTKHSFWSGFGAIFLLWIIMGLIQSIPNEHILANRVGQMLMLPAWKFNWIIMLLITGLIGGLAGGFSALAGFYMRQAFNSKAVA